MIDRWLSIMGNLIIENFWVAPLLAFVSGVLTAFTPCSLSSVPLIIGYIGGRTVDDTKKAFKYSLAFCSGIAVTFTVLGALASLFGRLTRGFGAWWYISLGVLMALMALQMWDIINIMPKQLEPIGKNPRRGYMGAVALGMLGGFFASPCATPVLVVLLAMIAQRGNLLWGILLLLLYSIGHSMLLLIAGTSMGLAGKFGSSARFNRLGRIFKIVMGAAILLLSFYMFYLGF